MNRTPWITTFLLFATLLPFQNCGSQMAFVAGGSQSQEMQTGTGDAVSCNDKQTGESWWVEHSQSADDVACATDPSVISHVLFSEQTRFVCINSVISTTGETRKQILSEDPCPPLTFNDTDQIATLSFNDNYPGAGDSDYNDFVAHMKVIETYNSLGSLTKINIEYTPRVRLSSADHRLKLVFDGKVRSEGVCTGKRPTDFESIPMFLGTAKIHYGLQTADGMLAEVENHPKDMDLVIFPSSAEATANKLKAVVTITNLNGQLNTLAGRKALSIKRYRSILFTGNCGIDLNDINPEMLAPDGAPSAFFVPINWRPPVEGQSIYPVYPRFQDHATYLKSGAALEDEPEMSQKWFNYLAAGVDGLLLPLVP